MPRSRLAVLAVGALALGASGAALRPSAEDLISGLRVMETSCRVVEVVDGDTVDLRCLDRPVVRARVVGYDAPELGEVARCAAEAAAGERARSALAGLARTAWTTEVQFLREDRHGRPRVDLRLNGERVARWMVAEGHARRGVFGPRDWCA